MKPSWWKKNARQRNNRPDNQDRRTKKKKTYPTKKLHWIILRKINRRNKKKKYKKIQDEKDTFYVLNRLWRFNTFKCRFFCGSLATIVRFLLRQIYLKWGCSWIVLFFFKIIRLGRNVCKSCILNLVANSLSLVPR